ncbi:MAG: nitrogenase-stabilizing/protective protein NifW [Cyanobacteria bacterium P01_A01_bin.135]
MSQTLAIFNTLSTAEDYLNFFGISYDPKVVNINRLHILRKFSQSSQSIDINQSEQKILDEYRQRLQNAYNLFLTSTSVEQKLFKVFQTRPKNVVMLSEVGVE